jgi:hypothetical protein
MTCVATFSEFADERLAAALHESAHAVVTLALGGKIVTVEIEPEPCANCQHLRDTTNDALVALAGPLAEWHAGGSEPTDAAWDVDMERAMAVAETISPEDPVAAFRNFLDKVQQLVEENWSQIRIVAAALLQRKRLTGDEVDEIGELGRFHGSSLRP